MPMSSPPLLLKTFPWLSVALGIKCRLLPLTSANLIFHSVSSHIPYFGHIALISISPECQVFTTLEPSASAVPSAENSLLSNCSGWRLLVIQNSALMSDLP